MRTEDVKQKAKAPTSTQRKSPTGTQLQCQKNMLNKKQRPRLGHSVRPNQHTALQCQKRMLEKNEGSYCYTASSTTSTQLQCKNMMFEKQHMSTQRQVNHYTTLLPKEDVEKKKKGPISTQRQAQSVKNFSAKKRC